jgi:hypothetical protein
VSFGHATGTREGAGRMCGSLQDRDAPIRDRAAS